MENIKIRKASQADIVTIANFQTAMAMETEGLVLEPSTVLAGVTAIFQDESKGAYYVCETHSKVVASLLITYEWSDWRNAVVYWLQSVYVITEYRKQGIFSDMYEFIKNIVINDPEIAGVRLYADKSNLQAQRVYEKAGMNGGHYITYEWMKEF